jgi:hypothetical protein
MLLAVALTTGNIPFWLVQYAFRRPKAFSGVLEFLAFRFIRTFLTVFPYVPPGNFLGDAKRAPTKGPWDKVSTITVAVLPVPADWRTHYAEDVPEVQAIERPGFMVTPPQAKASGAALAADGERAIIYLHGG